MKTNTFVFAQKVTGQDRKSLASVIATALATGATYDGPPSFAYNAGGWRIERTGLVRSPKLESGNLDNLKKVITAISDAGFTAEGDASVILSTEGHNGVTLRNLVNLISSKERLLQKALKRENGIIPVRLVAALNIADVESVDDFVKVYRTEIEEGTLQNSGDLWLDHLPDEIGLCFFNATMNPDEAEAYIQLALGLMNQAKTLKYASLKDKDNGNDKFSLRVFLNRIGFIGPEYKFLRKFLLSGLTGNSAFRNIPEKEAASNG